jgi:RNA polymerase sigma-70 factor (ECF subfamily)
MDPRDRVLREKLLHSAVLAGSEQAWQTLYDQAYDRLNAYASWRCGGNKELIADVVQETWLVAVRRIRSFDAEKGAFADWLTGIAANVLRNHFRSAAFRNGHMAQTTVEPVELGSELGRAEHDRSARVAQCLSELPERYEAVLRAKYLEKQSVNEIADAWNETPKARALNAEKLAKSRIISDEELRIAKVNLEVNRLVLAKLDEELPFLLGRTPRSAPAFERPAGAMPKSYLLQNTTPDQVVSVVLQAVKEVDSNASVSPFAPKNLLVVNGSSEAHATARAIIRVVDMLPDLANSQKSALPISGDTVEKLVQALNKQTHFECNSAPLGALLEPIGGIRFVGPQQLMTGGLTLDLEGPFGGVLEAISDVCGVRFDVREYGILVSSRNDPSAGTLIELWKAQRDKADE